MCGGLALTAGWMEWLWDIHLCVYSCLVPSSFIMSGLGLRFYFLAETLGYRTYNLCRWIIYNCISIQSLCVYVRIYELIEPTTRAYTTSVHFLMTWLLVATE